MLICCLLKYFQVCAKYGEVCCHNLVSSSYGMMVQYRTQALQQQGKEAVRHLRCCNFNSEILFNRNSQIKVAQY